MKLAGWDIYRHLTSQLIGYPSVQHSPLIEIALGYPMRRKGDARIRCIEFLLVQVNPFSFYMLSFQSVQDSLSLRSVISCTSSDDSIEELSNTSPIESTEPRQPEPMRTIWFCPLHGLLIAALCSRWSYSAAPAHALFRGFVHGPLELCPSVLYDSLQSW